MIPVANSFTVVLDASVLFPQLKRDLLLRFFEADLFRAQWSEQIQREWLSRAIEKYPTKNDSLMRTDALMREHFAEAWVEGYEKFIELVQLPDDPDDRHVVAAAIETKAQYIVTDNIRHFPAASLAPFGLEAGTADKFLAGTFEHYVPNALAVIREHRGGLRSEPAPSEYLMYLIAKGLPLLASRLQPHKHAI